MMMLVRAAEGFSGPSLRVPWGVRSWHMRKPSMRRSHRRWQGSRFVQTAYPQSEDCMTSTFSL